MESPLGPRTGDDGLSLRRNVAQHLGIAIANDIKRRAYQPTDDEVQRVRAFIEGCEVTWMVCDGKRAAADLETDLKREWMPPLTCI